MEAVVLIAKSVLILGGVLALLALVLVFAQKVFLNYGVCRVDINAGERTFEIEGGQTLLSGLYQNEVFIPSACGGRGSCGFCRVTVTRGGGPVLPSETPHLSRREIRGGVRLACQVKIKEDLSITISGDVLSARMFSARVKSTRSVTCDIKELTLLLDEPAAISFLPGQYIQVQAPSPEGPVFRAYSISSPVYEEREVALNVRLVEGGVASTYLHNLNVDDRVNFTGPYGEFRLAEDPATEIVCVGGGCGMAPIRNIIYSLYRRWPERSCWLFYGCKTTKDIFYRDDFNELADRHPGFHVVYVLSEPPDSDGQWAGDTGFVHLAVDRHLEAGVPRQAFLCGPPPMIEAVAGVLGTKGVQDIFYDRFETDYASSVTTRLFYA